MDWVCVLHRMMRVFDVSLSRLHPTLWLVHIPLQHAAFCAGRLLWLMHACSSLWRQAAREPVHCNVLVPVTSMPDVQGPCTCLQLDSVCAWSAGLQRFKALMRREVILVQRTLFIYYFKTSQVVIMVSLPCCSVLTQLKLFALKTFLLLRSMAAGDLPGMQRFFDDVMSNHWLMHAVACTQAVCANVLLLL